MYVAEYLQLNYTGPEVVDLQTRLKQAGFDPGAIDGVFGYGVQAAVMAFQRSMGLLPDGIVGNRTRQALKMAPGVVVDYTLKITPAIVSRMCPNAPISNIKTHLPAICDALRSENLVSREMVVMAIATIRAETSGFEPITEGISRFNTSPSGRKFDLYDFRKDIGNNKIGDGARFPGRGFVQLTGQANYILYDERLGLQGKLIADPTLANDSVIAARILAAFISDKERQIKTDLLEGDLRGARRAVNGGSHGLEEFSAAYKLGISLLT